MLEFRILGPLQVVRDGHEVVLPTAAKPRALLVALLLQPNAVVSADQLVDALWEERPPESAHKLVQVYVSQLRSAIGAHELETARPGYRLRVSAELVDAARFERLREESRHELAEGNAELARALAARALGLWRGPPLADIPPVGVAVAEMRRLDELNVACRLDRLGAELTLGRADAAVSELEHLCLEHPLREPVRELLALALYRSGRPSEALEALAEGRRMLRDELGLDPGESLRQLEYAILNHDPSLDGHAATPLPLRPIPLATSSLVGRGVELEQLRALVTREDVRIVTLTGAGGSGKTRLALELAHLAGTAFANGAAFVELAAIRDPQLVMSAVAQALAAPKSAGEALPASLAGWLRGRELLLVLDNFEQVADAGRDLVALAEAAPRLTTLVTSRRILHLSGESVFALQPLAENDAVRLFGERAVARDPLTPIDTTPAGPVRAICHRLDGLPLAIELAAARTLTLTPSELLARLEPPLSLLTGGPRDVPARQQTLRATLAWSFDLLDDAERSDLCRLSVFAGGCALAAAEAVCVTTSERLASLVDHSLLRRTVSENGSRYSLLETVRDYAAEQFARSHEAHAIHRRQLEYLLALAESANLSAEAEGAQRHDLVIPEHDNVRAAIEWALSVGEIELGLQLAVALENFWVASNPPEGMRVLSRLHESGADVSLRLRGRALRALGGLHFITGDHERAERRYEQSLATCHALGDERGAAILIYRLGMNALERSDTSRARELLEQSLETFRSIGSRRGETQAIGTLASLARAEGNAKLAVTLFERSASMSAEIGRTWWHARMLANLAELALEGQRIDEAGAYARHALSLARSIGDRHATVVGLALAACAAAGNGDAHIAGRLWGAVEAEEARGAPLAWTHERDRLAALVLGRAETAIEQGLREGTELELEPAVEEALALHDAE